MHAKSTDVPVEEALDPHSSEGAGNQHSESSFPKQVEHKMQEARKQPFLSFHHASWCPFSQKLRPVIQCLSKFYTPQQLQFLALEHTHWTASKLTLSHGVTRLPSIILHDDMSQQVQARVRYLAGCEVGWLHVCCRYPADAPHVLPQHMSVRYYGTRDLQSLIDLISQSLVSRDPSSFRQYLGSGRKDMGQDCMSPAC